MLLLYWAGHPGQPHVAGIAALMLDKNRPLCGPKWTYPQVARDTVIHAGPWFSHGDSRGGGTGDGFMGADATGSAWLMPLGPQALLVMPTRAGREESAHV